MLMEKARCPKCKTLNVIRHCNSPCCVWFLCRCKQSERIDCLVFDRRGRGFLEMKR